MSVELTYLCGHPQCLSTITIHPADAKKPVDALERAGWEVTGASGRPGEPVKVIACRCPNHAQKAANVSVPATE